MCVRQVQWSMLNWSSVGLQTWPLQMGVAYNAGVVAFSKWQHYIILCDYPGLVSLVCSSIALNWPSGLAPRRAHLTCLVLTACVGQKKRKELLSRPIICICNDQ